MGPLSPETGKGWPRAPRLASDALKQASSVPGAFEGSLSSEAQEISIHRRTFGGGQALGQSEGEVRKQGARGAHMNRGGADTLPAEALQPAAGISRDKKSQGPKRRPRPGPRGLRTHPADRPSGT